MPNLLDRHPWIPFVFAFLLLLGAWTSMIFIAVKFRPESVPLEHVENTQTPKERATPPKGF